MFPYCVVSPVRMRPMAAGTRFFEIDVRQELNGRAGQQRRVFVQRLRGVFTLELPGHQRRADDAALAQGGQDLAHGGDVVDQADIDGFKLRPKRETTVGDHQPIGMTKAAEQRRQRRVENAVFEHICRIR
jgi:hypothetical protein